MDNNMADIEIESSFDAFFKEKHSMAEARRQSDKATRLKSMPRNVFVCLLFCVREKNLSTFGWWKPKP